MKQEEYHKYISVFHDGRKISEPEASVIIVIYNTGEAIVELLSSLKEQSVDAFEVIVINNGKIPQHVIDKVCQESLLYIENNANHVSLARNIGTAYSRGEIVIFLDDDCLAHRELVESHLQMYTDPEILVVQGKGSAKKLPFYCHFQSHYDLGPSVVPAVMGFEANASVRKYVLEAVNGFDPELFGAEGLELSYRIVQEFKRPEALVYSPEPLIYHDFATGFFDYLEKCYRHPKMRNRIVQKYPHIIPFAKKYGPYPKVEQRYSFPFEKLAIKIVEFFGIIADKLGRRAS